MKKYFPLILISPCVIILDQITKWMINARMNIGDRVTIWKDYFDIVHVRNRGAAFGMLSSWNSNLREYFFYGVSIVALTALFTLYAKSKESERRMQIPLALILGGAIGNLIDRLSRGEVIDFLRFHWHEKITQIGSYKILLVWPSFNIADIAISCGAIYLAIILLFFDRKSKKL